MKKLMNLFRRTTEAKEPVGGITLYFLQEKLQRFTDQELSLAMQRGWRRKYDETNFYGLSTFDGEGGLLKMDAMIFTMQHFDRRVDLSKFRKIELPVWASHSAYTSFGYGCPGGIPPGEFRDKFTGFLGLFCSALLSENTKALFFVEDAVLLRYTNELKEKLRSGKNFNPAEYADDMEGIDPR